MGGLGFWLGGSSPQPLAMPLQSFIGLKGEGDCNNDGGRLNLKTLINEMLDIDFVKFQWKADP